MRKGSKYLVVLLALCLVLAITACGKNEEKSDSNGTKSSNDTSATGTDTGSDVVSIDPLGKYDPPINVSTWRVVNQTFKFIDNDTIDDNVWYRAYADTLGINVSNLWVVQDTNGSGAQKINVSIASNSIPDIMEVDPTQFKQLYDADLAEDLTEVYEKYASPLLKFVLESNPSTLKAATLSGKIMALPRAYPAIEHARVLWVRADWLRNLNLPEPKTMEDVFKISEAFATQDPDRNGLRDTFGLGINNTITGGGVADIQGFANGFHAYPGYWVTDNDGKLAYGSILPEMKDALASLAKMYKNGEIDPEFGVKGTAELGKDMASGKIGLEYGQNWNGISPLQAVIDNDPTADWKAYPIVSIDDKPALAATGHASGNFYVVKKGTKHPEAAIKMMNLYVENLFGETQQPLKYQVNEGIEFFKYAIVQAGKQDKNIQIMKEVEKSLASGDTSAMNDEQKMFFGQVQRYSEGDTSGWAGWALYGPEGSLKVLDKYVTENLTKPTQFIGPPTKSQAKIAPILKTMELEKFTKIILGQDTVESFDKFVDDWKKLGGDTWTNEVNEWADSNK